MVSSLVLVLALNIVMLTKPETSIKKKQVIEQSTGIESFAKAYYLDNSAAFE